MGIVPEEVLVLEVAGSVGDFVRAVRRTPGMEWLVESDEFDVEPDEDFARDGEQVRAHLYLVMANQAAMRQLLRLWRTYSMHARDRGPRWDYGQTMWRDLFSHLRSIRFWSHEDRLRETGLLEDWQRRVEANAESVPLEIELWFRDSDQERDRAERTLSAIVEAEGGTVRARYTLPPIRYHGLLAEMPIASAEQVTSLRETRLTTAGDVMFFRPVGQLSAPPLFHEPPEAGPPIVAPAPTLPPLVALLDGLPLSNHDMLDGRLDIDDPDGKPTIRSGIGIMALQWRP